MLFRRFGERIYRILRKHSFFEEFFFKDLAVNEKMELKRIFTSFKK